MPLVLCVCVQHRTQGNFTCPTSPNLALLEIGFNNFTGQPFPLCMAVPGCKLTNYDVTSSGFRGMLRTLLPYRD